MKFLNVVSMRTGKVSRKKYEAEKAERYSDYMLTLIESEDAVVAPFVALSHVSCDAAIDNGALRVMLFKDNEKPFLEFAVSRKSQYGPRLWERLCEDIGSDVERPSAPWCGVVEHVNTITSSEQRLIDEVVSGISCAWLKYRRPEIQKRKKSQSVGEALATENGQV